MLWMGLEPRLVRRLVRRLLGRRLEPRLLRRLARRLGLVNSPYSIAPLRSEVIRLYNTHSGYGLPEAADRTSYQSS